MAIDTKQLYESVQQALQAENAGDLSALLADKHAADIAEVYELLNDEERSRLLFALPAPTAAEVVTMLDESDRGEVVEELDQTELTELTSEMEPDDAADFLSEMPEEQREDILQKIDEEQSDKIKQLLTYEEDTAGGIMTTELIALPPDATVGEAIREIRARSQTEDLHNIYVIDTQNRLTGVVPFRQLVVNDKHIKLGAICRTDPVTVHVNDDQEHVSHVISKYDFVAVPVTDEAGRLVGRVTHDDIMDVVEEEADEDIYRMAGLAASEFEHPSIIRAAGIRLSWLVPCLISMSISAGIMIISQQWFQQLAVYASLVVFVPMIGAIGGNCGIQISTVIVRGLATGDLASSRFRTAFMRESRIALVMSPICGIAAAAMCRLLIPFVEQLGLTNSGGANGPAITEQGTNISRIALAVGTGMSCAILIAATLGMALPFVFRRIRVDPAIASGPIVTTANDLISVLIFLSLAALIMSL